MNDTPTLFEPVIPPKDIVLRPYQGECIDKIMWSRESTGNELVILPTGAGKSIVIANLAHKLNQPVLILQPSKEILEQNYEKLCRYVDPKDIGVYSASMGEKVVGNQFTFATIQSIYKTPELFKHIKLIILDEAHGLNPKSTGMYKSFHKAIGSPKIIGFTATPYRLDSMYVDWGQENARIVTTIKLVNRMKGFFWSKILFNMSMQDLIDMGYLCAPTYIDASVIEQHEVPLNQSRSEFDMVKFDELMTSREEQIMKAISYGEENSKSVLIFCSSVHQATKLQQKVAGSAVVTAKTPKKERDQIIKDFKNHTIKTVFNVGVLTTGFDHPTLDCIILLRPTRSLMLYVQMAGRGVRIAEGKTTCKIIDLTSTVKNMGRVETIKLVKEAGSMWELVSETGSWHAKELYSFSVNSTVDVPRVDYSKPPF